MKARGFVYIVGAGPGNPELITVKGLRSIAASDVILHDRLVHPRLIGEARTGAIVVNVGKREGFEDGQQEAIHRLMIDYADEGLTVCRLKGGDPFVFGRGGEEVQALVLAGIPFEVVPGVSSAVAALAAAGIPITHRDYAHGFLVIAGSRSNDFGSAEWAAACELLARRGTVVVMMGLARLPLIVQHLLSKGCCENLPVALISKATWTDEQILFGDLSTITRQAAPLQSPALLVAGNVVRLGDELQRVMAKFYSLTAS